MTGEDHKDYYARREAIARQLAEYAAELAVSKIHAEMAAAYHQLANGGAVKLRVNCSAFEPYVSRVA